MAILQVRDIDDRLYETLKTKAKQDNRSLSQEVISILERFLANPFHFDRSPTQDFLSLSGGWVDERKTEEIIAETMQRKQKHSRFDTEHGLFD